MPLAYLTHASPPPALTVPPQMFATCFDGKLARNVESCPPCNDQSCGPLKHMVFDEETGRCEVRWRQAPLAVASEPMAAAALACSAAMQPPLWRHHPHAP